mgnify:CR=1 FL=1|jgi:hypothetical protein
MKGIVFTEFLEMVEQEFGLVISDRLIEECNLASEGIYTAVGTYDPGELLAMVAKLSQIKNIPVPELVKAFGVYLYSVFKKGFPAFFEEKANALELLLSVHDVIHVEVKKLYPEAVLPTFTYDQVDTGINMYYRSTLGLADLAEGLITASLNDDSEEYTFAREDGKDGDISTATFSIRKAT